MEFDQLFDEHQTEPSGDQWTQLSSDYDGLDIEKLRTRFNLVYPSAKIKRFEFSR